MAVGYCTLYGDMAGGLAVISDVPKTMVYDLARLCESGTASVIPEADHKQSSHRRNLRANQTDQDYAAPYDVLDAILKAYVEDLQSPEGNRRTVRVSAGAGAFGGIERRPK